MFDLNDSFTLSTTLRLLQTSYRAQVLAQIELLRKARAYKARYYTTPDTLVEPIPAYGQIETQVRAVPGTYVWGISFYASTETPDPIRVQITDTSTEVRFFVDYLRGNLLQQATNQRAPMLLPQPRLIPEPGQLNVEMYNDNSEDVIAQLVLYCAEPVLPNPDMLEANHYAKYRRLT